MLLNDDVISGPKHEFKTLELDLSCYPAAAKTISDLRRSKQEPLSMADIKAIVCAYFGVSEFIAISDKREPWMLTVRYIAMYFCYHLTDKSSTRIGVAFGRDHSTVLYGTKKVAATENPTIKRYVAELDEIFNGWPRSNLKWKYTCRKIN